MLVFFACLILSTGIDKRKIEIDFGSDFAVQESKSISGIDITGLKSLLSLHSH